MALFTHYLTLCNLLWLVVSVNAILQRAKGHRRSRSGADGGGGGAAAADILRGAKWEQSASAKQQQQQQQQRGGAPSPSPAPVARLYLLGWGAGAVVTAVCCAVDVTGYGLSPAAGPPSARADGPFGYEGGAGGHHCFMRLTPFLAGVALPAAVFTALMVGCALSAWCVDSSPPSHITEQVRSVRIVQRADKNNLPNLF